jgi:hypothetical protein
MLDPTDLIVQVQPDKTRLLLMSQYILNAGAGKLEVIGKSDSITQRTVVTQHVYRADKTFSQRPAGIFLFHPTHDHWHVDNFARYEIWSLANDGDIAELVALSDKVSYCLRDTGRWLFTAPRAPEFLDCEADVQGITPGWIDSYTFDMPGQSVDITDLVDGVYALRSVVDPADRILESNNQNNAATIYFQLVNNRARALDRSQMLQAIEASE